MKDHKQKDLLSLGSTFSKSLKKRFGKGPESCQVLLDRRKLYISIRNFITPAEEVLIANEETNLAMRFRASVMKAVIEDFVVMASSVLDLDFRHSYHDWNYHSNRGIVLLEHMTLDEEEIMVGTVGNKLLEFVEYVGVKLYKKPERLKILTQIQSMCVVEAIGVQTPLATLVYQKGSTTLIHQHIEEIKFGYLKYKKQLEQVFNHSIEDLFLVGDYECNRYIIIITFTKNSN